MHVRATAWVMSLALSIAACGAAPPRVVPSPPPEHLAEVATAAIEEELRALGFVIGPHAPANDKPIIVATRATARWTFALAVESAHDERGPKWVLRLTVFHEPGRELKGEIAPSAIVPGADLDAGARRDLVRALGQRAARQFAENFN